ncbi:MAG TPA: aspartate aminotransferase family protein, partial [Acidobacteriota bacterium]|nr:aspartate aminotransferase family protein [Acidobacteriota bacterium]
MLEQGIFLPPSQFEAWFLSIAHTADVVAKTVVAATHAFAEVARGR